ncbi:MAG TPA: carbohydrate-binding protein, partial [Blastocatellia bacterium]|nr:carbohydrate-binding protein [Blastocatellia bacterium]
VELATKAHSAATDDLRSGHVGYYLIGSGWPEMEREIGFRWRLHERFLRAVLNHPTAAYLGSLAVVTFLILGLFLSYSRASGASGLSLIAIALLLLGPVSDLALSALNLDITILYKPRPLPKMNTTEGIPEAARTFVVTPTILSSEETVRALLENMEVHYLANRDDNLFFALLGDFADAPDEEMPDDDRIVEAAIDGLDELNARYSDGEHDRFHLFHRRRVWNPSEEKWMGWERKRGKLHEFNRILRGARDTSYIVSTANQALLSKVRYVITLDSDTQLPRGSARRLIGTALHPLNQPRLDPGAGRVIAGYGILQPRVSMTLMSSSRSWFARIFSGHTGVDPYTTAVSDVYQDLFGEGSYTGKGLYDVDAFEAALAGRVPENLLLSHDLFESLFARAALVTDAEFLDDYPSHYDSYAKRQHRWTRGDWQIARWLFPWVRSSENLPMRNRLPLISRWKILDNLRRSLVAPAMFLWLAAAWTVLPGSPSLWTIAVLAILAFPIYAHVTNALMLHPRGIPWTSHFWNVWGDARTNTAQAGLSLILLAHQAYLQVHAIALTFFRKHISKKKLLEWMTAEQTEKGSAHDLRAFWQLMWPSEVLVLATALAVAMVRPEALLLATAFLIVWAIAPLVANWVSRELDGREELLLPEDKTLARLIARRTWRFFETFVGEADHWLAPDNFQEDPRPVLAHRTSPTDIGLLLLSTAAAHDFGYLSTLELAERFELTIATMEKLDRYNGHFLNWYDTTTLNPLTPQYVSTVDSGNLAGHLLALKQVCVQIPEQPLVDARVIEGLIDTISLMRFEAGKI